MPEYIKNVGKSIHIFYIDNCLLNVMVVELIEFPMTMPKGWKSEQTTCQKKKF